MVSSSPRLVDPADLYDGPEPQGVSASDVSSRVNFTAPAQEIRSRRDYVATITAALDMLGARIVVLIAVIAACVLWSYAVYEPELQRTYAAVAFSLTVFLPSVALYWRRG